MAEVCIFFSPFFDLYLFLTHRLRSTNVSHFTQISSRYIKPSKRPLSSSLCSNMCQAKTYSTSSTRQETTILLFPQRASRRTYSSSPLSLTAAHHCVLVRTDVRLVMPLGFFIEILSRRPFFFFFLWRVSFFF